MNEVQKFMEHMNESRFDWRTAQSFLAAGMGCRPQIFEQIAEDGGGWEVALSLRDSPNSFSTFRDDLWVVSSPGSGQNKKWPTLEVARKEIRDSTPAQHEYGVTVHFLKC